MPDTNVFTKEAYLSLAMRVMNSAIAASKEHCTSKSINPINMERSVLVSTYSNGAVSKMSTPDQIKSLLGQVLNLGDRANGLSMETPLLGGLPELDSLAVATVIAGIEDQFGIFIEDDEINGETFQTVGTLSEFVDHKLVE